MRGASRWFTVEGVILLVLGVLALALPFMAGLAGTIVFGWVLLVSGVIGLISAFSGRGLAHTGWSFLSAVIALVVGLFILWNPFAGAVSLTLLIGAYFLLDGCTLIALALDQRRRSPRWGWMLASGVLDVVLAALIVFVTPVTATLLIGLWLGIDLVFGGIALIGIGIAGAKADTPKAAANRA